MSYGNNWIFDHEAGYGGVDQTDAEHDITEKLGQTCACVSEFSDFWSVQRLDDRPKLAKLPNIDAVIHALTYLHDQDAHTTFFVFFGHQRQYIWKKSWTALCFLKIIKEDPCKPCCFLIWIIFLFSMFLRRWIFLKKYFVSVEKS